jgi:DNA modification methylase
MAQKTTSAQTAEKSSSERSEQSVPLRDIKRGARVRSEMGDIDALAHSIKTFGLIQPIVLTPDLTLIAGGRRLEALRRLNYAVLTHGTEFIWNSEADDLLLKGMELEENLKRKALAWPEEIASKRKLFQIMQKIHGVNKGFGAGKSRAHDGFSMRRLAEMLGESISNTSRDLELANYVVKHPVLSKLPNKSDAIRKLDGLRHVAKMQVTANNSPPAAFAMYPPRADASVTAAAGPSGSGSLSAPPSGGAPKGSWTLYEGPFENYIHWIPSESIDLVLTDLPYAIGQIGQLGTGPSALTSAGLFRGTFQAGVDIANLLAMLASAAYRVLRNDRYAVIFYGAIHHCLLYKVLEENGFDVDPIPFIWLRDKTGAPGAGVSRYDPSYDQAFVARKGSPKFVIPNQPNYFQFPSVRGSERLHAGQKPVEVMQKFIRDMTVPGGTIIDMFAGSGTTGEASLRLQRKPILFELDPMNCNLIKARLGAM